VSAVKSVTDAQENKMAMLAVATKLKPTTPRNRVLEARKAYAATLLNRAWNHLWLDSEDTRQLGLELVVLYGAMQAVKYE
jgi:hypothetical protein